jgi:iron complex outermembrane receptor protein
MKANKSISVNAIAVIFASGAVVLNGAAQEARQPEQSLALEEVIVTATKRETSLLDVPSSVSVVSGDFLTDLRANDVADLSQFVPNLSFQDGREAKIKAFNIRGVGTATFNDGVEDSVGIVVDGVTLGRAAMGMYDLFDVERIEVLRGPQGWLFGKSASAGVVNIVTKDPNTEEFEADATLSYGDHIRNGEWKFNGAVSGPINEQFAYRLAGYVDDRGGIVRDYFRERDDHDKSQWAIRGKLLFKPNEQFDAKLSVDYLEEDNECCAEIPILALPGGRFDQFVSPFFTIDEDNRNIAQNERSFARNEVGGASLDVNYEVAGHTLTSITAYRRWETFKTTDEDKTPLNFFDVTQTDTENEQFTQEVRLASPLGDGRLDYLLGVHFYWQNLNSLEIFSADLGAATEQNRSVNPVRIDARSIGVFGSGTFRITEQLNLIFGVRYTNEDIDGSIEHDEVGTVVLFPEVNASESNTDSEITGRVGLQYYPTDVLMLFATYGTGYKAPAFNAGTIQPAGLTTQIVPGETSEMFEIGMKSRWFDERLRANVTLFHTTFEDFQADAFVVQPGGAGVPVLVLSSVEEVQTRGVEVELTGSVTDGFLLGASFSYTDAQYEDFTNAPCYFRQTAAQGCVGGMQDLSGRPLPYQGDFQYNIFFDYQRDVGQFGLFAQGNYGWIDERDTIATLDPQARVDSLGLLSARLGVRFADDRYELSVFGNNLTDENYATKIRSTGLGGGYNRWAGIPRVVGVSATVRY